MKQQHYVVQEGDTLWDLADRHLGSPLQWHRIFTHNNRSSVIQITGSRIKNPDVIFPGQTLMLPILHNLPKLPKKRDQKRYRPPRLKDRISKTYVPFATTYKLDDLPMLGYETFGTPAFRASISFSGDIAIRLADKVPLSYVTNQGLEMTFKQKTDSILQRLLTETHLEWDKPSNAIKYACMMVNNSDVNGHSTAIGVSGSSNKPVPVLRAEFRYPELKGYLDKNFYCGTNVKVVVEIEPKAPNMVRRPNIDLTKDLQQAREPSNQPGTVSINWHLIGAGLALLGGTIIADFLTGVSVADDFVTIPYAVKLIASGLIIYSIRPTAAIAGQQLTCAKSH